jgi:eukaryotic-like serine/threonine-protein kinase
MSTFEEHLRAALSPAYDIERELEGGGMSRVFVATDTSLGRKVVIKVLPPELTAGVNRERFRREIQVAAQLQHPHIVTLLAAGEDGDLLYYTMPFIEGESLRTSLEKGPLSVKEVVRILHDVVDALAYAHARGVIHRDIKPGNILKLGQHALVTDFGVAKALNAAMPVSGITTAGMAIGTPAYMAPEQLAGDPAADHRIDIYAVGLLAYELLTGESPFTGPSPQATMAAQLTRDPEPLHQCCPDVAPPLSAIIMQCLAKEPSQRPPTAEALMTALDSITLSSGDVKVPATKTLPAVSKRRRRLTIAAGLATVVVGSAVALFASQKGTAPSTVSANTGVTTAAASAMTGTSDGAAAGAAGLADPPKPPAAPVIATSPVVSLTREDSLAIARAVQKRLAQEEAVRGREHVAMFADSITAQVRRIAIDSIIRANLPHGAAMPVWEGLAPPAEWGGKRRVVVTVPRTERRAELNAFGSTLAAGLRSALAKEKGVSIVDADSVNAALAISRARGDIEKALKPDIIVSPTFAGMGDTVTVLVTIRDVRSGRTGTRVASARVVASNPEAAVPALVQLVVQQMASLRAMPRRFEMSPNAPARGIRER